MAHLDDFLVSPRKRANKTTTVAAESTKKKEQSKIKSSKSNSEETVSYAQYNEDDDAAAAAEDEEDEEDDTDSATSNVKKALKNASKSSVNSTATSSTSSAVEVKKNGRARGKKTQMPATVVNNSLMKYFEPKQSPTASRGETRANSAEQQPEPVDVGVNRSFNDEPSKCNLNSSLNISGSKKLRNSTIETFFKPLTPSKVDIVQAKTASDVSSNERENDAEAAVSSDSENVNDEKMDVSIN
jgi:hypothetical protein